MTHSFVCWRLDGSKRRFRFPFRPRRVIWWMNSPPRMVKSGSRPRKTWEIWDRKTPPNASERIASMGTQEIRWVWFWWSQNLAFRFRFLQENHWTQEMKRKSLARRQERVRKCARDSGYERSVFLMRLKDGFDLGGRLRGGFTLLGMASKWSPPNIRSTLWPGWSNPKDEQCNG